MVPRGRTALLVYNSAAVLAGVAVTFVLVRSAIMDAPRIETPSVDQSEVAEQLPLADRMAFAPSWAFAQLRSADAERVAAAEPELRPSIAPGTERSSSWSTAIHRSAAITPQPAPSVTVLPTLRLPWQAQKPGMLKQVHTYKSRLAEIAPPANARLAAKFEAAKAIWPPAQVALVAIKDEKALELHARADGGAWHLIHRYRILAASGGAGPKLRQGDRQVPEGLYGISFLNPNSAYHVSMRVNYPNAFDRQMAAKDGRKDLGGDIMIHGKNLSAGCLAMGDEAVEELFVLAAQTGLSNIKLVIAPTDFRQNGLPAFAAGRPAWLPKLYAEIASAMVEYKAPRSTGLLSFFTQR
jgi:hypothetical protein